jgi:hypothetical protein
LYECTVLLGNDVIRERVIVREGRLHSTIRSQENAKQSFMPLLIVVKVAGRSTGKSRTGYGTPQGGDWLRGALPLQSLKRVATISTRKEKPEIIGIPEWENERGGKTCNHDPVIS